jgi:peptidoglycan hydrolase-like protein with peptidoglycan-binding domain
MMQRTASTVLAALALSGTAYAGDRKVEAKASVSMDEPADGSWANGMTRDQIKDLQRALSARGVYQGKVDGSPGRMTAAALRNFQIQNKLENSHGVDAPTRDALGLRWDRQPVSGTRSDTVVVQRADSDDRVTTTTPAPNAGSQIHLNQLTKDQAKTLQSRLHAHGLYSGEVDGVPGDGTRVALERYYRNQADLAAQGIISDATIGSFSSSTPAQVKVETR